MKVAIELYGRLRDAGLGPSAQVELAEGAKAADALRALAAAFGPRAALLEGAALASESCVLRGDEAVPEGRLAALPPVCGG